MESDVRYMSNNSDYLRSLDQAKGITSLQEAIRIAVTRELERDNPLLSNEMAVKIAEHCKRVAKNVASDPIFVDVAKDTVERSKIMAERLANENAARYRANVDGLAAKKAEYETALNRWIASDEITRRFMACRTQIEELLPIPDDRYNTDNYTKQQAIRSRGLVMAALFGMRQMGSQVQNTDDAKEAPDGA